MKLRLEGTPFPIAIIRKCKVFKKERKREVKYILKALSKSFYDKKNNIRKMKKKEDISLRTKIIFKVTANI